MIAGMLCFGSYETTDYLGSPRNGPTRLGASFNRRGSVWVRDCHGSRLVNRFSKFIYPTSLGCSNTTRHIFNAGYVFIRYQRDDVLGSS
ncbi:MAG: hypothetical protein RL541_673 [Pseudomonadota bacterium]